MNAIATPARRRTPSRYLVAALLPTAIFATIAISPASAATGPGTLVIQTQTSPDGDPASFDFTTNAPGAAGFTLSDGQAHARTIPAATYTVTERATPGWELTGVTCAEDAEPGNEADIAADYVFDVNTGTVTIVVDSNDTFRCTFFNTKSAQPIAAAPTVPASAPADTTSPAVDPAPTTASGDPSAQAPTPAPPKALVPLTTTGSSVSASSGTARISGPRSCVSGPFRAVVRGRGIARVVFLLDGKHQRTVTGSAGKSVFSAAIDPRRQSAIAHRVTAQVRFRASANTAARTLRMVYVGCPKSVVLRFAG